MSQSVINKSEIAAGQWIGFVFKHKSPISEITEGPFKVVSRNDSENSKVVSQHIRCLLRDKTNSVFFEYWPHRNIIGPYRIPVAYQIVRYSEDDVAQKVAQVSLAGGPKEKGIQPEKSIDQRVASKEQAISVKTGQNYNSMKPNSYSIMNKSDIIAGQWIDLECRSEGPVAEKIKGRFKVIIPGDLCCLLTDAENRTYLYWPYNNIIKERVLPIERQENRQVPRYSEQFKSQVRLNRNVADKQKGPPAENKYAVEETDIAYKRAVEELAESDKQRLLKEKAKHEQNLNDPRKNIIEKCKEFSYKSLFKYEPNLNLNKDQWR